MIQAVQLKQGNSLGKEKKKIDFFGLSTNQSVEVNPS